MARPRTLTAELQKRLCVALEVLPRSSAAPLAGIPRSTLARWTERGEKALEAVKAGEEIPESEEQFLELVVAMDAAEAKAENSLIAKMLRHVDGYPAVRDEDGKVIKPGAPPDWRAGAWIAERRWQKRWLKPSKLEHTGADGGPVQVQNINDLLNPEGARDSGAGGPVDEDGFEE